MSRTRRRAGSTNASWAGSFTNVFHLLIVLCDVA
jgi:hypothetical protein